MIGGHGHRARVDAYRNHQVGVSMSACRVRRLTAKIIKYGVLMPAKPDKTLQGLGRESYRTVQEPNKKNRVAA